MVSDSETKRPSLNAVRAPVMMIYVLAIIAVHGTHFSAWLNLLLAAVIFSALSAMLDWRGVSSQLSISLRGVMLSVSLSLVLYVLMKVVVQAWVSVVIASGSEGSLAVPLSLLLEIRTHVGELSPVLIGLAGGALLIPAEELFWRGFIQRKLVLRLGKVAGVCLAAVLFGGFYALLINSIAGMAAGLSGLVFGAFVCRQQELLSAMVGRAILWVLGMCVIPLY